MEVCTVELCFGNIHFSSYCWLDEQFGGGEGHHTDQHQNLLYSCEFN